MTEETKTISRATYLQALGLFTMAERHRKKADEFQEELTALLGADEHRHLSDAIYDDKRSFDNALKLEGYVVEDPTP